MHSLVLVEKEERTQTVTLTLNRPEKRNALNRALMRELCAAIKEASSPRSRMKAIVLKGEGEVFCAGLDLSESQDPVSMEAGSRDVMKTLKTVASSPLITVAAVHGAAVAGGAALMLACDFSIAAEGSLLAFPETRRGLVPALALHFLMRRLKEKDVKELVLLCEPIEARAAFSIGLINRVVPYEALKKETVRYLSLALKGAPSALSLTKKVIDELSSKSCLEGLEDAFPYHLEARVSQEASEGISAFLEKREPLWEKSR